MTRESKQLIDCGKCGHEQTVLYHVQEFDDEVSVKVHKCTNCKYQYGIKELHNEAKFTIKQ